MTLPARHPAAACHPVIDFIEMTPNDFDDANANPRSWTYVSKFLMCWETDDETS